MEFSNDQIQALQELNDFVFNGNDQLFLLRGKPGVGKTTIIKEFIKTLRNKNFGSFTICAPTHKAAAVLSNGLNEEVLTLHKFLSLSPVVNLLEFDLRDLRFTTKGDAPNVRLTIVDESSMINDELFDTLIRRVGKKSKIIFIADLKQLQPVKAKSLSKVSLIDNHFELVTNHRQDDPVIMDLIEESRHKIVTDFQKYNSENIELFTSAQKMATKALDDFTIQYKLEYAKFCKILTYTNERVRSFNEYIHNRISDEEYYHNTILTGYSAYKDLIQNSSDYLVKKHKEYDMYIKEINESVSGYSLELSNIEGGDLFSIFILGRNTHQDIKDKLGKKSEELRIAAINANSVDRGSAWGRWYNFTDSFCNPFDIYHNGKIVKTKTLDYGYAITLHKSQGSTYDLVYYDNNSIQFCKNQIEKRQLQHVALSRVKEQLNVLL